ALALLEKLKEDSNLSQDLEPAVVELSHMLSKSLEMNAKAIGVILPLTGDKASFSTRAMQGIQLALKKYWGENTPEIFFKDSQATAGLGVQAVKELIFKDKVSVVIGGLFPEEAKEEYLEAKKYGTLFISLAPIYLPFREKDHLLIEIPGSVESQMRAFFSEKSLAYFGKKGAIFYPKDIMGEAFAETFWHYAQEKNVKLTAIGSFAKATTDYRPSIEKMLGLTLPREREDEYKILQEIYSLDSQKKVNRTNILPPVLDFDWVFIPALPNEALQIIPTFGFLDATGIKFVGIPSWRGRDMEIKNHKMGQVFLVGNDSNAEELKFQQDFIAEFKSTAKIIESLSFESFSMVYDIFSKTNIQNRDVLSQTLLQVPTLTGLTSTWRLVEGLWLKEMEILKFSAGKALPLFRAR
ncbi:MAG: ABC transporter substrate-binding protein, partial [Bacteriovoracaceae bacterium]|nr:ABC transporter substrate-binding protein [Bacteriovoracaceae bacterium]